MEIRVVFNIDNAEFDGPGEAWTRTKDAHAVHNVLIKVASKVNDESSLDTGDYGNIFDDNGNKIGKWEVVGGEYEVTT